MSAVRMRMLGAALGMTFALLVGCASGGGAAADGEPVEEGTTRITIENFHSNAEDLQIYVQRDGSAQRVPLGTVPRGQTQNLVFGDDPGQYRLIADQPIGTVRSQLINISHRTNITWNIQQNRVVVSNR
jgi:hypothetical protein